MASAGPAAGRGASTATAPAASGWRSGIAAMAFLGSGNPVALTDWSRKANPLRALGSISLSFGRLRRAGVLQGPPDEMPDDGTTTRDTTPSLWLGVTRPATG
jgi:hypothetical protein